MAFVATIRSASGVSTLHMIAPHVMDVHNHVADLYVGRAYACTVRPLKQGGAA